MELDALVGAVLQKSLEAALDRAKRGKKLSLEDLLVLQLYLVYQMREEVRREVQGVESRVGELRGEVADLRREVRRIEEGLREYVDRRLNQFKEYVDGRFSQMEKRLDELNAAVRELAQQVGKLTGAVEALIKVAGDRGSETA